jgi:hypothetical protein
MQNHKAALVQCDRQQKATSFLSAILGGGAKALPQGNCFLYFFLRTLQTIQLLLQL